MKRAAPWMTERLKKCIKEKGRLYKLFVKGRIQKVTNTNFRNRLTNIIRRVKSLYYAKLFLENAKNSEKVWVILNGLLNRSSKNTLKELVVNNGRPRGDSLVNYINNYFIDIAVSIRGQASQSSIFFHPPTCMKCQ